MEAQDNTIFKPTNHINFSSTDTFISDAVPTQCLDTAAQVTPALTLASVIWSNQPFR